MKDTLCLGVLEHNSNTHTTHDTTFRRHIFLTHILPALQYVLRYSTGTTRRHDVVK